MSLAKAEQDFLSDLSRDTHGVWEWPQIIKLHCPDLAAHEVAVLARSRLLEWIRAGRISLAAHPIYPTEIKTEKDLICYLETAELTGDYIPGAPSLDLKETE